jgi:hypothetical protein
MTAANDNGDKRVANDNGDKSLHQKLDLLIAEQHLLLSQVGKVIDELRARKRKTQRRVRTTRQNRLSEMLTEVTPTEADRAEARRIIARERRR